MVDAPGLDEFHKDLIDNLSFCKYVNPGDLKMDVETKFTSQIVEIAETLGDYPNKEKAKEIVKETLDTIKPDDVEPFLKELIVFALEGEGWTIDELAFICANFDRKLNIFASP